jgi:hypothetical protein
MTTCGSTPVIPAIHHTVAFRLRHPSGSPDETAFVDAARALATIPGMEDFRQFRQVSPKSDFTFFFLMRFADADAYSSYNEHPVHVAFVGTAGTARSATSKSPTLLPSTAITFELSRFAPGGLEQSQVLRPSRPEPSRDSVSFRHAAGLQGHDRRAQPDQWSLVTLKAPTQPVLRQQPGALRPQPVAAAYGPKIEARAANAVRPGPAVSLRHSGRPQLRPWRR